MPWVPRLSAANQEVFQELLKQVDRLPRLTAVEEAVLVRDWAQGSTDAKDQIILSAARNVVFTARNYARGNVDLWDLVQEGMLAVLMGMEHYDRDRGVRVMTFLGFRVRKQMIEFLWFDALGIKPSAAIRRLIRMVRTCYRDLQKALGAEPTSSDIAWALGIPEADVEKVLAESSGPLPLEALDFQAPVDWRYEIDLNLAQERRREKQIRVVHEALAELPPREALVISLVLGLDGQPPLSTREIGDRISLTAYRVLQLKEKAVHALRQSIHARGDGDEDLVIDPELLKPRPRGTQRYRAVDFSGGCK